MKGNRNAYVCACLCASGPRTRAIVILNALTRESPDLIR